MIYPRRLPSFEYLRPRTVPEACSFLSQHKGRARVIAGGTDLLPKMRLREMVPEYLIGLKSIPDLNYIEYDEARGLRFGALATLNAMETSPVVREKFNALFQAVYSMASTQVRYLGTVAGNLCSAVPSADTAPALFALGVKLKLVSPRGERIIPVEEFFAGPHQTVLSEDELLVEIQIPTPPIGSGSVYLKHSLRRAMDLAIVGVAVVATAENGVCKEVRIALGAVAPTPIRASKAEMVLSGKTMTDGLIREAAKEAAGEARPLSDIRSSAEYRREMVEVLTRRAVKQAWDRATGLI